MNIGDVKAIKFARKFCIQPGQESDIIERQSGVLIIIGLSGMGFVECINGKSKYPITVNTTPRLDHKMGDLFIIKVPLKNGSLQNLPLRVLILEVE